MQSIDFQVAQQQLSDYLNKKLIGEKQSGALERRAQRLVDKWWARPHCPIVLVGSSGLRIVGCVLGFGLGTIKIKSWKTQFTTDPHNVCRLSPDAIALGQVNNFQLFIAKVQCVPNLVARNGAQVLFWKAADELVPPAGSPLRVALDRANMLGYLDYLKGEE